MPQMIISPRLWSVIDGAGSNDGSEIGAFNDTQNGNPFALFTSPSYQQKMATVNPGLWSFITMPPTVWNLNNNPPTIATNAYSNLINNFYKVDPSQQSAIIIGVNWGPNDLNITSQATYGQMIHALAVYFQNQIMPNGKRLPVIGFTGQNEPHGSFPPPQNDIAGYYNQIIANCKNVTLPGGGTYIVVGPCPDSIFMDWGDNWTTFSQKVPGMDVFQWDNFPFDAPISGGQPMSKLQTPQSQGGISDYFSNGIFTQAANNVVYQPIAYDPCGNIDSSVSDTSMGDYRGAVWTALQAIQSANASPVPAWNQKWDSALQGSAGFLFNTDPDPTNPITPAGYLNGRASRTMTGPRWNVTTNAAGLTVMTCNPTPSDLSMMIINAGQGAQSGPIAFSHWPINTSGNGTLNMWQLTSATTADGTRTTITVTAGVSASVTLPDPSVTIISSIA